MQKDLFDSTKPGPPTHTFTPIIKRKSYHTTKENTGVKSHTLVNKRLGPTLVLCMLTVALLLREAAVNMSDKKSKLPPHRPT